VSITDAITEVEKILPGKAAPDGQIDPRWQGIIEVGKYIESNPKEIWAFIEKWGKHSDEDIQAAIASCLLEHLLEFHFDYFFEKVENLALSNKNFAKTFISCAKFGQSEIPKNSKRFDLLNSKL